MPGGQLVLTIPFMEQYHEAAGQSVPRILSPYLHFANSAKWCHWGSLALLLGGWVGC